MSEEPDVVTVAAVQALSPFLRYEMPGLVTPVPLTVAVSVAFVAQTFFSSTDGTTDGSERVTLTASVELVADALL